MFISRLFIGVISCSAATEKAHVINLSDAHRHDDYIRFLLTRPLLKRFHANRSPASSSLTIIIDGTIALFFKVKSLYFFDACGLDEGGISGN